jgi:hypothetical protein
MVMEPTEREEISGWAQAGDLPKSDSCNKRLMTEFFPLMDIGKMHFHCRQTDSRDSITDCDARVGISGRVNNYSVVSRPSFLDPGNQLPLAI